MNKPIKKKIIQEIKTHLEEEMRDSTDSSQIEALKRIKLVYDFLPIREYDPSDVIVPSALVELEFSSTSAFYLVVPSGGGMVTRVDGFPVQVITPDSPLGEALLGKKMGDQIEVKFRGGLRQYTIRGVS